MQYENQTNQDNGKTVPDDLFDDSTLDDLLDESTAMLAGTPPTITAKTQDIFSLDDLLAESMAITAQREQMKSIRKAAANGLGTKEEREAGQALVRKWEAEREWHKQANVMVFNRCTCTNCRTYNVVFAGFYERQTHRSNASIERLVKVDRLQGEWQKEVRYLDEKLPTCEDCARLAGFPVEEDDTAVVEIEVTTGENDA